MEYTTIQAGHIQLEAAFERVGSEKGVIVTHPHPLYGGNMENPVVTAIADVFRQQGFSTLRFNFRGTGKSTGMYSDGIGEQDDVNTAIACLKDKDISEIWLAGYSFGSKINASVMAGGGEADHHVMVSPPVAFISFDDIERLPRTGLVITGEHDQIAPPDQIQHHLSRWGISVEFNVVQGADHFYSGCLDKLADSLSLYLNG
jgi:alpha/beta superfamily hydrolase